MRRATGVLLAGLTFGSPALTDAQTRAPGEPRSSRPADRGGTSPAPRDPAFAVTLLSGYDGDLLGQAGDEVVSLAPIGGSYVGLQGSVFREYRAGRLGTTVRGSSAARYFPSVREFVTMHNDFSIDTAAKLGRRITIGGTQAARSSPQDVVSLAPRFGPREVDTLGPVSGGYAAASRPALLLESGLQMTTAVTRRSMATIDYAYLRSTADVGSGRRLHSTQADYAGDLGRRLGFRVSYARHQADQRQTPSAVRPFHDIGTELTYNRHLARRRTRLQISAGSSTLTNDAGSRRDVRAHVVVAHTLRRRWEATLNYSRDLQFVETTGQPIFADSIAAAVDGAVGRRVRVRANVAYHTGTLAEVAAAEPALQTYQGVGRITFALSRRVNPFIEYAYYQHRFDEASAPAAWPPATRRQRLEAGLTVSATDGRRGRR